MSVTQEILRIQSSKSDIKKSISNKGVSVPQEAKISELSQLIDLITTEVEAGRTLTLPYGSNAVVSLRQEGNHNYLDFSIPQGYTPQKGKDYYTQEDIQFIKEQASNKWTDF